MLKLFTNTGKLAVAFCERCSKICDAGCRRATLRERMLLQASRHGVRI